MEEIVTVDGRQFKLVTDRPLTMEQKAQVIADIRKQTECETCSQKSTDIYTLPSGNTELKMMSPATCPTSPKYPGQTLTMSASGSGGTPPYTIVFQWGAVEVGRFTGVPENTTKSVTITITDDDAKSGAKTALVTIIDSCPGTPKSCTDSCSVTLVPCPVPTCTFTVT